MRHVLVVDDDPIVLEKVRSYLCTLPDVCVSVAANGSEAIGTVEQHDSDFDLVVCDLNMPDNNGIELIGALSRLGFAGDIVILSIETPNNIKMAARLGRELGLRIVDTFQKPLTLDHLHQVSRILFGARELNAASG